MSSNHLTRTRFGLCLSQSLSCSTVSGSCASSLLCEWGGKTIRPSIEFLKVCKRCLTTIIFWSFLSEKSRAQDSWNCVKALAAGAGSCSCQGVRSTHSAHRSGAHCSVSHVISTETVMSDLWTFISDTEHQAGSYTALLRHGAEHHEKSGKTNWFVTWFLCIGSCHQQLICIDWCRNAGAMFYFVFALSCFVWDVSQTLVQTGSQEGTFRRWRRLFFVFCSWFVVNPFTRNLDALKVPEVPFPRKLTLRSCAFSHWCMSPCISLLLQGAGGRVLVHALTLMCF